jgi:hypothetical protein
VVAQHPERLVGIDCVAGHQDSFRLLDHRPAPERSLQAVVLGETLQGDVDRALQLLGGGVDDVGEDAPLGSLVDVGRVLRREQRNYRAEGLADDLGDQIESVLGVEAEPHQRDIRSLPGRHRADLLDVDLAGNHLVPEPGHNLGQQFEALALLVRDQDTEIAGLLLSHRLQNVALPDRR